MLVKNTSGDSSLHEVKLTINTSYRRLIEAKTLTLKLGGNSPKVDAFMRDYRSQTTSHPFSHRERLHNGEATSDVVPRGDHVRLSWIKSVKQGKGAGSRALRSLTDLADKHGVVIKGTVSRAVGMRKGIGLSKGELHKWYSRHGFEREKDDDIVRHPR